MAEFSPMMKHFLSIKEQYKDCIIFYRLGDFYEMFFDDAITASRELEITLTGRDCGQADRAPMCGVPFHAAENYISKLIEKGYKVAICEQLEDAKEAKGIVARDVIRVVTPGTVTESNMLDEKKNNYIMSIFKKGVYFGVAICDITTGEFFATKITETNNFALLLDEISKYNPAEIIVNKMLFDCKEELDEIKLRFNCYITNFDETLFKEETEDLLKNYSIVGNDVLVVPNQTRRLAPTRPSIRSISNKWAFRIFNTNSKNEIRTYKQYKIIQYIKIHDIRYNCKKKSRTYREDK